MTQLREHLHLVQKITLREKSDKTIESPTRSPAGKNVLVDDLRMCILHGASLGPAGTVANATSIVVKPVAGLPIGSTLTIVDVTNNSLDVGLLAAISAGPKTVKKFVDREYFHGYGRTEHTLVSTALPSASPTGAESPKSLAGKTKVFDIAIHSIVVSVASTTLTSPKSRSVHPNHLAGKRTDLIVNKVAAVDSSLDIVVMVVVSTLSTTLKPLLAFADGRPGSAALGPTTHLGTGTTKDIALFSSG